MECLSIQEIEFMEDFRIGILLSNQHSIIYNFKPKLNTARFIVLNDEQIFRQGRLVKGKMIRWSATAEITLDEILLSVSDRVGGEMPDVTACLASPR